MKEGACSKIEHIEQRYLETVEYLNTKYTEDRFVNIVKVTQSTKYEINN